MALFTGGDPFAQQGTKQPAESKIEASEAKSEVNTEDILF